MFSHWLTFHARFVLRLLTAVVVTCILVGYYTLFRPKSDPPSAREPSDHWGHGTTVSATQLARYFRPNISQTPERHSEQNVSQDGRVLNVCTMESRLRRLQRGCQTADMHRPPSKILAQLLRITIVDDKHHVLGCIVPKAGTTSWLNFMAVQIGGRTPDEAREHPGSIHTELRRRGLSTLANFANSPNAIRQRLRHFFKFLVVRHPFARLHSTYRDKFMDANQWTHFFHKYKRFFRQDKVTVSDNNATVSFQEFLWLIAWNYTDGFSNRHWDPASALCDPCAIHYEHVSKLETITSDAAPILAMFHGQNLPHYNEEKDVGVSKSKQRKGRFSNTRLRSLEEELRSAPKDVMSKLLQIYRMDLALFGYDWSPQSGLVCDSGGCC